ncbi:TPA: hypothetical protein ACMX9M_005968, partial [Klebsiella variicola]
FSETTPGTRNRLHSDDCPGFFCRHMAAVSVWLMTDKNAPACGSFTGLYLFRLKRAGRYDKINVTLIR